MRTKVKIRKVPELQGIFWRLMLQKAVSRKQRFLEEITKYRARFGLGGACIHAPIRARRGTEERKALYIYDSLPQQLEQVTILRGHVDRAFKRKSLKT